MTGPVLSDGTPSARTLAHPITGTSTASGVDGVADDRSPADEATDEAGLHADIARAGSAATVISLAGAVDIATAPVLASALATAVSAGRPGERVVLELNRVRFLGACGLGVILAAHADATRRGGTMALVVDEVAPPATTLRFLQPGRGPDVHSTLTAALHLGDPGEVSSMTAEPGGCPPDNGHSDTGDDADWSEDRERR